MIIMLHQSTCLMLEKEYDMVNVDSTLIPRNH